MNFGRCTNENCIYNVYHQCTDKIHSDKCAKERKKSEKHGEFKRVNNDSV